MIQSYVLLGTLGVHSIEDIRQRKITVTITLFSGILGIFLHILFQNRSIYEMMLGAVPGMFILALGYVTEVKIGMGDGAVFMLTGLYLGIWENLILMLLTFFLAGIWGLFLFTAGRKKKTECMPLIPFLFLGYGFMLFR